jgi:hypothetical protein
MKAIAVAALMVAISALAIGGFARQPAQDQTSRPQAQQTKPSMMQGRMMHGGTGTPRQTGQMMNRHQQMMENMNKLMQNMAAIEAEKDPAALRAKLAEHRALLEQMRSQMMQQGEMMQMIGCPNQPATKSGSAPPAAK